MPAPTTAPKLWEKSARVESRVEVRASYAVWANDEKLDTGSLKPQAFSIIKKTDQTEAKSFKATETPKTEAKFGFIEKKEVEKQQKELKKKEELPLELLEILDSDTLNVNA